MENFFASAISFGVIFLFGCVGEILTEKSGHLNLGIPGIMCMGAAGGCLGVKLCVIGTDAPSGVLTVAVAILFAVLFAGALGAVYAFLTVSLRANQNVTGLACTIFGVGFTTWFINSVVIGGDSVVSGKIAYAGLYFFNAHIPGTEKLGWFGGIFLEQGVLAYLAIALAVVAAVVLRYTRVGLNVRAIGENPATADAVGVNVTGYKYGFIMTGAAVAGLGGLCYVMGYMNGTVGSTVAETIQGIGWLSIALVIFTMWRPALAILGSILFGALYFVSTRITGISFEQIPLLNLIPFVVTILVLIVTSIVGHRETQPPASLGLPYFREDR